MSALFTHAQNLSHAQHHVLHINHLGLLVVVVVVGTKWNLLVCGMVVVELVGWPLVVSVLPQ